NITNDYILSIGSIHLRKNLMTLIRVFKSSDLFKEGFKLVIAGNKEGKRQNHYLELRALAERLELSDSIVFLGNVDYEEVQHLYNCARCMISLSEYEGFPQVFLEAMTFGVPVICGRNSSFEEVVGSAGHYIDIKDVIQIKKTLRQVTLNESDNKINEGFRQSAKFEKRESVKSIVSIYENTVY
ncbi:MAG TPA: glycosyltransferase, partial [Methanosarcinales archaeon]|nr:glycosyltransferase [Methanosarcinales archaeon]